MRPGRQPAAAVPAPAPATAAGEVACGLLSKVADSFLLHWLVSSYRTAFGLVWLLRRRHEGPDAEPARARQAPVSAAHAPTTQLRSRAVRFKPEAAVFEFERRLFGGGGIPEEGAVSLGLGPLVAAYERKLGEEDKEDKDSYACEGFLEPARRAELLGEWMGRGVIVEQLLQHVEPIVEQTRRERSETASSRQDQRRMPENEQQAILYARSDAAAARKASSMPSPRRSPRSKGIIKRRRVHDVLWPASVPPRRRRLPGMAIRVL